MSTMAYVGARRHMTDQLHGLELTVCMVLRPWLAQRLRLKVGLCGFNAVAARHGIAENNMQSPLWSAA